jgi:hypothetical protein
MSQSFSLEDSLALSDLQVYLSRAGRVEDGSVRVIAADGVLAVYSAIVYPRGLLDHAPTVLGLRTFTTDPDLELDAVVPVRSLLDRVARLQNVDLPADDDATAQIEVTLPLEVSTVTWAGISPPRGGWRQVGETEPKLLVLTARSGIEEVATHVPAGTGEQLVQRVRAEVWGRPIDGLEWVPAGAAFAAFSLGFLSGEDEEVPIFETGPWTRLSTERGHVLVKSGNWTLRT